MFISFKELIEKQKSPLDHKIETAVSAIGKGFEISRSQTALAFSGGKDSTVLWHLIRTYFPGQSAKMAVIFGNTGVEYPESLKFARELGELWGGGNFREATPERLKKDGLKYQAQVEVLEHLKRTGQLDKVLKSDGKLKTTAGLEKQAAKEMFEDFERRGLVWKAGQPKSYWWCADQYGWPILGKAASKLQARRINIDCFLQFSETSSGSEKLKQYYDLLRRVKISQACCDILKKEPSEKVQAELKVDVIFKGLMAAESHTRKVNFCTRGYMFESNRAYIKTPFYHCNPISIWTDDDVWEYIRRFNVPYSPLYDLEYEDVEGNICRMKRNGCIGCFTDYGRKNSHMYVLRRTHPNRWKAVMKYGMAAEIQKLKTIDDYRQGVQQVTIFDVIGGTEGREYQKGLEWAMKYKPCSFD